MQTHFVLCIVTSYTRSLMVLCFTLTVLSIVVRHTFGCYSLRGRVSLYWRARVSRTNESLVLREHRLSERGGMSGCFLLFERWRKMLRPYSPQLTFDPPLTAAGHPCGDRAQCPPTFSATSGWIPFSRSPLSPLSRQMCSGLKFPQWQVSSVPGTWYEAWADIWQVPATYIHQAQPLTSPFSCTPSSRPTEIHTRTPR